MVGTKVRAQTEGPLNIVSAIGRLGFTAMIGNKSGSKAVDALMDGLVDYAGLFPPASESMRAAVESYASYRAGPDAQALGRFIVPLARLTEFEEQARALMPRGEGAEPWRLSVLVGAETRPAAEQMPKFNCHHWSGSSDGHAIIDAVELKAATVEEIEIQDREIPKFFQRYFEIPLGDNVDVLVKTIARVGARAKVRTGGTDQNAFPTSRAILSFLVACERERVPFKATAGLHHPIRGSYRLTYEPNSASGTMYGFLNVFVAAALLHKGESESIVLKALEESDAAAFEFTDDAIAWRKHRVDASELRAIRSTFATSFGSCSFREPVDELARIVSR